MRVLIWTKAFAPSTGGIERYSATLARGLSEQGLDVIVATETGAPDGFDASVHYRVCRRPSHSDLARLMDQADVVHLCGPAVGPMRLALRSNAALAIEHSGYQLVCPSGMLLRYPDESICPNHFRARQHSRCVRCLVTQGAAGPLRAAARVAAGQLRTRLAADVRVAHIAVSQHVARRLGLPDVVVIPHGIDPPEPIDRWLPEQFAYVGRLVREKGVDILLDAFSTVARERPDAQLRIVGDGPLRDALETNATALGVGTNVTFLGGVAFDQIDAALADVATVVVPSRCEETFGLVALEQAARGRQVITSDIGGLGEVARAINARLVPPGDRNALADNMLRGIEHAERTNPAPTLPESLTAERMVDRHIELYEHLLKKDRPRGRG